MNHPKFRFKLIRFPSPPQSPPSYFPKTWIVAPVSPYSSTLPSSKSSFWSTVVIPRHFCCKVFHGFGHRQEKALPLSFFVKGPSQSIFISPLWFLLRWSSWVIWPLALAPCIPGSSRGKTSAMPRSPMHVPACLPCSCCSVCTEWFCSPCQVFDFYHTSVREVKHFSEMYLFSPPQFHASLNPTESTAPHPHSLSP